MTQKWHVARTKTGGEVMASVAVASKGFPVFLPIQMVQRSHARKVETVSRPLFPRYLFVAFDPKLETHGEINYCRGVANRGLMVTAGGDPIAVPDAVIDQIRARESAMLARVGEITTGYGVGEIFKIAVGPFTALDAAYMGEENGKVWALVDMFGKSHLIALDFEAVPLKKSFDRRVA